MRLLSLLLISMTLLSHCSENSPNAQITPVDLTCEYMTDPVVVDIQNPRLGWINAPQSTQRGLKQTAWQIRVATAPQKLNDPDLWNSQKVVSDESIRVPYAGKLLNSRQECWWQVRVWDQDGHPSEWSEPAFWRMGLLHKEDWQAKWIGAPWQGEEALPRPSYPEQRPDSFGPPAPMFRKEFIIEKEIKSAVAFITGLGYFELYANGRKVGNDVLVPNQTNYGRRPELPDALINLEDNFTKYKVMYLAYDISALFERGNNTLGSILGNGFYNPAKFWAEGYGSPRFLCQLHLTYQDGSEEMIITDESWKTAKSPILMDMVYYGEIYDARKEQEGWNTSGFDDSDWQPAVIRKAPEGELVAHTAYPDKVMETFEPRSITQLENGNYLVDFGVEISGWVRLNNVNGPAGHQIDITFNGNLYSGDNTYICGGGGPATYAPRFNWFVFSGIEIKNWPGELKPEHLTAEAVYTYTEETATFQTSNLLFNEINEIWKRSQVDNMHGGIASDCPHRERSAYTGDGQVAMATVIHNFDVRNFYDKWIRDIRDAQNPETGYVPNGAPWQPGCGGGVAWGAAICIMPWDFYLHYGAKDVLDDNYPAMKEYIRYMKTWVDEEGIMHSRRVGGNGEILKWFNLGEWATPELLVPDELVHTFYFWMCADITSKTAGVLGRPEEAEEYRQLAETTRNAFHRRFYDESAQSYGNGGGNIFALKMGIPEDRKEMVLKSLQQNIRANNGHFDTGIFGTRFFFEVLAENGLNQLAFEAMNKRDYPSYGHWIELGSTTTREHWDNSGSHNHPMFGGGLVWLYRNLAGIQADPEKPGYRHVIFKPQPTEGLDSVAYHNKTIYGDAGISWKKNNDQFLMDVKVPVGCEATVYVPVKDNSEVTFGDGNSTGVTFISREDGYEVFEVESGEYLFVGEL